VPNEPTPAPQPSQLKRATEAGSERELRALRHRVAELQSQLSELTAELARSRRTASEESQSRFMAEQQLGAARTQLELAIDAAQLATWKWDLSIDVIELSAQWGHITRGFDLEVTVTSTQFIDRVHADDRADMRARLRELLDGAVERARLEFRFIVDSGESRWIEGHAAVIEHDAEGRARMLVGTLSDVTDRVRMRLAAQRSELRLRTVLENLGEPLLLLDRLGRIEYRNPAWLHLVGAEHGGASAVHQYLAARHRGPLLLALSRLSARDPAIDVEVDVEGADREPHHCEFKLRQFPDPGGDAELTAVLVRDVTERKRIEETLRKARDAADSANRAKSQFLANISHELRTPLNGIMGLTQLLSETVLQDEQREYLRMVDASARSLLELLNDLLDLSKIEAGKMELEAVEFSLDGWLQGCLETIRPSLRNRPIDLRVERDGALPAAVLGDAGRLRQVLLNLLSNAVKFTDRGRIELLLAWHPDPIQEDLGELEVSVVDTGIGIAAEKLESIFDAFTQADSSTTRRYGGTGLGLAISAELARLMHGTLRASSQLGQGSRFTLRVPLRQVRGSLTESSATAGRTASAASIDMHGMRVLIAEDHPVNRLLAERWVKRLGALPRTASDGAEAIETYRQAQTSGERFDVVLMDLQMPKVGGLDATRRIRAIEQQHGWQRTPIIALSASAMPEEIARCRAAGMDAFVAKPFDADSLEQGLREAGIDGRRPNSTTATFVTAGAAVSAFDVQRLKRSLDDDPRLLKEIAEAFEVDSQQRLARIDAALARSDWPEIAAQAHALKGSLLGMTATQQAKSAAELERQARAGNSSEIQALVEAVRLEIERVRAALRTAS
jgi:PAS domain S-box-containing protein